MAAKLGVATGKSLAVNMRERFAAPVAGFLGLTIVAACVATDVGDTAQIVGETGVIVPPRDPAALAEGWRKLIALGAEGRAQLGEAARARIQLHYSLTSMVRQYEELYLSLVEHNLCVD